MTKVCFCCFYYTDDKIKYADDKIIYSSMTLRGLFSQQPVPIQRKQLLKRPGDTGRQQEISFYWCLKLTCYSPQQLTRFQ